MPVGSRVVVRMADSVDPASGRMTYRDFIGHVRACDGRMLTLRRDPAANGSRPSQDVRLDVAAIVAVKPIPERRYPFGHRDGSAS
ncbi:DUF6725 family protein [Bifidobacterium xylocopae]|uniref:Ferrous iron transport protein A n=1 Tax=Bifidobacterium xylocopae TaxID=2493119 RepID=A0A366KAL9_9BIFI|nr:DUF6725 family protein [Bifidobacterium xylocopae]RBP98785.1 hypothetical protein CRD59_07245 [Bifidobacterium xylocopae]